MDNPVKIDDKKYQVILETTGAILEQFDELKDAADFSFLQSKKKKNDVLLLRESKTGKILSRFGILLDWLKK